MVKLAEMRKARGLSQKALAEMVRHADPTVDQAVISVLERGDIYPGEKLRDALCSALECEEGDLYDGIEALFVPASDTEVSETTKMIADIFDLAENMEYPGPVWITRKAMRMIISERMGEDISDRTIREWISKARREGLIIANGQDGRGYYRPETREELEAQYRQNQHRAMAILAQQKHIRRRLRA